MGDIANPRVDIRNAVAGLLEAEMWAQYGHLSYREMAAVPALAAFREPLLQAAEDDEYEQALERGEVAPDAEI